MKLYNIIIIEILLSLILISSCKDSITPPTNNKPDTTSHNIIWEADTLGDWNSRLRAIWGSSPNDIWAAGWIIRGNWGTNLVHYDGEKWEDYDYFKAEFYGMFGLDSNNIWAVGNNLGPYDEALIAHYNGKEWKTVYVDINLPSLGAVWASAPDDVFAVGAYGTIIHFNGFNWKVMDSGTRKHLYDIWGFASDDVYICGGSTAAVGDTSKPILLHYNGSTWSSLLDTNSYPHNYIGTVWGNSSDNIYFEGSYNKGYGLYQGNINEGWNFVLIPDDNNGMNKIRGNSKNNIFIVGAFGITVHYNGINWQMYPELLREPGGPNLWDVMVFDNSVFIVGSEYNILKGIVYKGTITN